MLWHSLYTGSTAQTSNAYVDIVTNLMGEYGGFERICTVTSDNEQACINTRMAVTEKDPGLLDLLMKDLGKPPWINQVISESTYIA